MLEAKLSIICLMKNCSQEDLTTKILVENLQHNFPKMETLSPSRTSSLSSPGALGTGLTPVLGAAGTTLGSGTSASGALDLSSSSFSGNLATVKREASVTEDKKFGQVLKTDSSPNIKTSSTTNVGTKIKIFYHLLTLPGDFCVQAVCAVGSEDIAHTNTSAQDHRGQPGARSNLFQHF